MFIYIYIYIYIHLYIFITNIYLFFHNFFIYLYIYIYIYIYAYYIHSLIVICCYHPPFLTCHTIIARHVIIARQPFIAWHPPLVACHIVRTCADLVMYMKPGDVWWLSMSSVATWLFHTGRGLFLFHSCYYCDWWLPLSILSIFLTVIVLVGAHSSLFMYFCLLCFLFFCFCPPCFAKCLFFCTKRWPTQRPPLPAG